MSFFDKQKLNRGQAMITAVIFFIIISLIILFAIINPVLRQLRIVGNLQGSRESLFLAEAAMEDTLYRLRNNLSAITGQTLTLNGHTVITEITTSPIGRTLTSISDFNNLVRKVETQLIVGVGASFGYGVQTGNGGFVLGNNAGVDGSVYSNGDVLGSNGAYVTGAVFAANTISLTSDQSNMTPSTPPNWITFRDTSVTQDVAQKFQVSVSSPINKIVILIKKTGNPSDANIRLTSDGGGEPGSIIAAGSLSASQVVSNFGPVEVFFSSSPTLYPGTDYWLVIDNSSNSTSHYYTIAANDAYSGGLAQVGQYGGAWSDTSPTGLDVYFEVYLGGLTSKIDNLRVATKGAGDTHSHTVTNSSTTADLYCQTGSGNNKSCDTSKPDPTPQPFPISDGNINQWRLEAEAGGTIFGDFVLDDDVGTLGPKKITGDMIIINSAELTITGTIYVQGDIIFSNNSIIRLLSGFSDDSGVVVSDGKVDISNNAEFKGSGSTGSFVMIITTNDCPQPTVCVDDYAIRVANNAGTVILNAQKGTIFFSNNSGAKEATADKIILNNNAFIEYEGGLTNVNFSGGPSGGWDILSWREVE
jgi:hypothetical protein